MRNKNTFEIKWHAFAFCGAEDSSPAQQAKLPLDERFFAIHGRQCRGPGIINVKHTDKSLENLQPSARNISNRNKLNALKCKQKYNKTLHTLGH